MRRRKGTDTFAEAHTCRVLIAPCAQCDFIAAMRALERFMTWVRLEATARSLAADHPHGDPGKWRASLFMSELRFGSTFQLSWR